MGLLVATRGGGGLPNKIGVELSEENIKLATTHKKYSVHATDPLVLHSFECNCGVIRRHCTHVCQLLVIINRHAVESSERRQGSQVRLCFNHMRKGESGRVCGAWVDLA
eukprot:SAG11_NODE_639_length_8017_cov_4.086259_6_plen_109_part_00